MIRARLYETNDWEHAEAWYAHRVKEGSGGIKASIPPTGITALDDNWEPVGICWLYLSLGCGVAFAHHLIMRPGITAREAREIGQVISDGLQDLARSHDYGVIFTTTMKPSLAFEFEALGWKRQPGHYTKLAIQT